MRRAINDTNKDKQNYWN